MPTNPDMVDSITEKTKALGWSGSPPNPGKEKEDAFREASRLLVGKLFMPKVVNKIGVREAIFKSWSFVPNLVIEEGNDVIFIFSFPSASMRQKILAQCPWSIKGVMLVLKPWELGNTLKKVILTTAPIWMQIHGLPLGKLTRLMAVEAASKADVVLDVDFRSNLQV